jgi:acyl-CoA dehydrogenase
MDFSFGEEQEAVRELAARIFGDLCTHERLREIEANDEHLDRKLWSELAAAGLLGIGLPESVGGAGLGFLEAALVAEEAGRAAAIAPVIPALVASAAIAEFARPGQAEQWLPGIISGAVIPTVALVEVGAHPFTPSTFAHREASGWRLEGVKTCVPAGTVADLLLVSASVDGGTTGLFVLDATTPGVTRRAQRTTAGNIQAQIEFSGVSLPESAALGGAAPIEEAVGWVLDRYSAALCVQEAGACQAAVKLTATYTTEREQFGKAIATFQAVGQRAADAYIDAEGVRLTAWQAVWRLAEGLPAALAVAAAKYWADEGAQRVVHAAQHLHGGVGVDRDYPLHRYYILTKELAVTLGGATPSLLRIGDILATEPV